MRSLFIAILLVVMMLLAMMVSAATTAPPDPTNITYISGTCKKAPPSFNMSAYYNQNAMLVTDFTGVDTSGSQWDLGIDGAYKGYNVMICLVSPTPYPSWPPSGFWTLMEQKGFSVTLSCNMAGLLSFPAFHVFVIFDRQCGTWDGPAISNADAQAVVNFYVAGGGFYGLTDDSPCVANVNLIFQKMPSILRRFQLHFSDDISAFQLNAGNPVADNQFGHHVAFTGISTMYAGSSLSIPMYDGVYGIGVFAPMGTVMINRVPTARAGEPTATYVKSHPTQMYIDPPVQLQNISDTCNWGRMVVDSGWTRYGVEPMRTGSHRFAANVVVWLLNIEKLVQRNQSGNPYATPPCNQSASSNSSSSASDQTQVLGCSNGDAVTLKAPTTMCHVGFTDSNGSPPPKCLALVVTEGSGTTCVVDLENAAVGTYWIVVDGKNTSLTFSVTAASLTPRGTVASVSGTCVKTSATSVSGCTDGSSITIDWTLPYPRSLTLGLGSSTAVCSGANFSVSGTLVYCKFTGLNKMPRGRYQTYINGVATGIPLTIQTDFAPLNKVLCSGTRSPSLQATNPATLTRTLLATRSPTATVSLRSTRTPSAAASMTITDTVTRSSSLSPTQPSSGTVTQTDVASETGTLVLTATPALQPSQTLAVLRTLTISATISGTRTTTKAVTATEHALSATRQRSQTRGTLTLTGTVKHTPTPSWGCVPPAALTAVFAPYAAAALQMALSDVVVRNGTSMVLSLPPISGAASSQLHAPWFETGWSVPFFLRVQSAPNQMGFAAHNGFIRGGRLVFPDGLASPLELAAARPTSTVPVIVELPPLSDYRIYEQETAVLLVPLSSFTLGTLCGATSNVSDAMLTLVAVVVTPDVNAYMSAAQDVFTPIVVVMSAATPFAAPDVQALIMVAMMPCSNTYQKRSFAMFRALSVFTLDDTYRGVLWGNLIANIGGIALHFAIVVAVSVKRGISIGDATVAARFPSAYLHIIWLMTYASNAFASLQILSDGASSSSDKALGALMLLGFCILLPAGLLIYVKRYVSAYYKLYEFHKWRRSETGLRVRLLSTFLLPVGRWEPEDVRRRLGFVVTMQCRPEFVWILLPTVSPMIVALFGLVRNQNERICVWIYIVLAFLHLLLLLVIVWFRPLRSMIEDWFAAAAYIITTIYLVCSAVNLAYPPFAAIEKLLAAVVIAQIVLLLVRLVYHLCHVFIARRLVDVVPNRVLFEWNYGEALIEDAAGANDAGMGSERSKQLYAELDEILNGYDDEDVVLHLDDVPHMAEDFYLPLLKEQDQSQEQQQKLGHDVEPSAFLGVLHEGRDDDVGMFGDLLGTRKH